MSITTIVFSYILTLAVFLIVDLVWLGLLAKKTYKKYLGMFLADNVNWAAAIIFYFLFVVGISIFAIYPAVGKESFSHAAIFGALFGFFTYSTYDLTNLATLKGWPLPIVFIDILWGSILSSIVSSSGYFILLLLK